MKRALLLLTAAAGIFLTSAPPAHAQKSSDAPGIVRVQHRGNRGHGGNRGDRGFRGGHGRGRIYVRPSFYWGWGSGWWGYPYGYGYGYGYGSPYYGHYRRPYGGSPSHEWAAIDTDVSPEGAHVYLDGTYVGTADDFDGHPDFLYLKRGRYRLEFRLPGYDEKTIEVQARPGMKLRIDEELRKVAGAKQYGSYDEPQRPEGELRRFWAKRRDVAQSVDDEDEIYGGRAERRERGYDRDDEDEEDEEDDADEAQAREREEDRAETNRPRDRRESDRWRDSKPETRVEAARETARLRVRAEPSDAVVFLDDRFVGTAGEIRSLSRGVSVSPGKHTVTVSRPGFKDRTVEIEVDDDETKEIEVTLSR